MAQEGKSKREVPVGFSMALAQNVEALARFSSMNAMEQSRYILGASTMRTRKDMREYVNSISQNTREGKD